MIMATNLNIREKLNRLVAEGKSGVLALFDAADSAAGYDYIVYLHSLGIVYVVDSISEASGYFDSTDTHSLNRWVASFADRENAISLNDIGEDEQIFLNSVTNDLLWHMTHEWELGEDEQDADVHLNVSDCPDADFTLGFADTLECDIKMFRDLMTSGGDFSVCGVKVGVYQVGDDDEKSFYFVECYDEIFTDEDTNESLTVERHRIIFELNDWRTLYAKARTYLWQNYRQYRWIDSGFCKTDVVS